MVTPSLLLDNTILSLSKYSLYLYSYLYSYYTTFILHLNPYHLLHIFTLFQWSHLKKNSEKDHIDHHTHSPTTSPPESIGNVMQSGTVGGLALHISEANPLICTLDPIPSPTSSISPSSGLLLSASISPILNKQNLILPPFDAPHCIKIALKGHLYLMLPVHSPHVLLVVGFQAFILTVHIKDNMMTSTFAQKIAFHSIKIACFPKTFL